MPIISEITNQLCELMTGIFRRWLFSQRTEVHGSSPLAFNRLTSTCMKRVITLLQTLPPSALTVQTFDCRCNRSAGANSGFIISIRRVMQYPFRIATYVLIDSRKFHFDLHVPTRNRVLHAFSTGCKQCAANILIILCM